MISPGCKGMRRVSQFRGRAKRRPRKIKSSLPPRLIAILQTFSNTFVALSRTRKELDRHRSISKHKNALERISHVKVRDHYADRHSMNFHEFHYIPQNHRVYTTVCILYRRIYDHTDPAIQKIKINLTARFFFKNFLISFRYK